MPVPIQSDAANRQDMSEQLHDLRSSSNLLLRRIFNIVTAIFALFFLFPFLCIIGILIKSDSPGPIFYKAKRVGKNGKEFEMLKFRTMYKYGDQKNSSPLSGANDERVTRFGKWLRATKMNELPQIWNVLKGEMDFVGPRPEDPSFVAKWPEEVRNIILSVNPGITSPASIIYRDEASILGEKNVIDKYLSNILPSKLRLDLLYLRFRNFLTDLDVFFLTFILLLPNVRKISIPDSLYYSGPFSIFFSRYLNWFVIDCFIAFLSVSTTGVIWRLSGPLDLGWGLSIIVGIAIALIFSIFNAALGVNRIEWSRANSSDALALALSCAMATGCLLLFNPYVGFSIPLPPSMIVVGGLISFFGFVVIRYRERILTGLASRWLYIRGGARSIGERVLLVGAGDTGELAIWLFSRGQLAQAFNLVGFIDHDPHKKGSIIRGLPVLGSPEMIPEISEKMDIGLILISIPNLPVSEKKELLSYCEKTNARIVFFPNIAKMLLENMIPDEETHVNRGQIKIWLLEIQKMIESENKKALKKRISKYLKILDESSDHE